MFFTLCLFNVCATQTAARFFFVYQSNQSRKTITETLIDANRSLRSNKDTPPKGEGTQGTPTQSTVELIYR